MTVVAITGASGYLGGRLAQLAQAVQSIRVRPITRTDIGWLGPEAVRIRSLVADADRALDGADTVIHLAGANEVLARSDPDRALDETVASSRAVASACSRLGIARLIYVSTIHVYGEALRPGSNVDESTVPEPRGAYPISRLASEHTLSTFSGDTDVVIFRLTNGVGPPASRTVERWTLVANDLCRQAVESGSLRIASPGQWRHFIPIDDVAKVLFAVADPAVTRNVPAGTYNLASGRPMTIKSLAELISAEAAGLGLGEVPIQTPSIGELDEPYSIATGKLEKAGLRVAGSSLGAAVRETLEFCAEAFGNLPQETSS